MAISVHSNSKLIHRNVTPAIAYGMVSKQDGTVSVHGAEWQCLHIAKVHKLAHETQFSLIRQVRIGRVLNLDAQRVDKLLANSLYKTNNRGRATVAEACHWHQADLRPGLSRSRVWTASSVYPRYWHPLVERFQ